MVVDGHLYGNTHILKIYPSQLRCTTVYHESFEAEKFRGFRGFLLLRETFFHEIFQLLLKSGRL